MIVNKKIFDWGGGHNCFNCTFPQETEGGKMFNI